MTKALQVFAQIKKVDEAQRLVYGRAAQEEVDKSDEVMDYASSKPHFANWSAEVAKDSGNRSLGNVRAMHGKIAAGKLTAIEFNDAEKAVDVVAKIVDDAEWKKVLEGVYTGFSIGGSYVGTPTVEKVEGKDVKRYTAKPNELSLVDRPCIPSAKFFEVRKADGSAEQVEFKEGPADPVEVTGTDAEVIAFGKMLNESELTMADAIDLLKGGMPAFLEAKKKKKGAKEGEEEAKEGEEGPAKDKEGEEEEEVAEKNTPATLRKGVYDCGYFTSALQALVCLKKNAAYEAMKEGDNSAIPAKLDACVALVGEVFKAFIDEVMKESKAGTEAETAGMFALAEQAEGLRKSFEGEPLLKLAAPEALAKLAPQPTTDTAALEKMVQDAITPLSKQLGEAQATIKKLESMPAAPRIALMAVTKGQDLGTVEDTVKTAPVRDYAGKENEVASLIKGLHQSGGAPVFSVSPLRKV